MDLENLANIIIKQAEEKSFGIWPNEIILPEKIALIHSEITEAYDAFQKNNIDGKDGFHEELSDVLIRTVHLARVFNSTMKETDVEFPTNIDAQIAMLHKITSDAYEKYRHKKEDEFAKGLEHLINALIKCSKIHQFDLEEETLKKIKHNDNRTWDKNKLNEQLFKAG